MGRPITWVYGFLPLEGEDQDGVAPASVDHAQAFGVGIPTRHGSAEPRGAALDPIPAFPFEGKELSGEGIRGVPARTSRCALPPELSLRSE